jgi:integrase/recombinase XerD
MTEHTNDRPPPAVFPAEASHNTLPSPLSKLVDIPEEEIWLAKQKSKPTRRAYNLDVQHFMRTLHIKSYELRRADHRAVIAWERIVRNGGRRDVLAIHPNTAQHIRAYLDAAGHADDIDGPMFRPLSHNRKGQEGRRHMDPDAIDRVLRKHAKAIGLTRGYSGHSMRATFITTALENGATLDDVQRAAGHSEPGTTKLYDRRGYNPQKSASFFATY